MKKIFLTIFLMIIPLSFQSAYAKEAWEYSGDGWDYYAEGDADSALDSFFAAIQKDDEYGWAYYGIAVVYHYLESDYQSAIDYYLKAQEIMPDESAIPGNLGWVYYSLEQYSDMADTFEDYIKMMPDESDGYYGIGISYQSRELYDEAAEYFNLALEINPSHLNTLQNLVACYFYLNDGENLSAAVDTCAAAYETSEETIPQWVYSTAGNYFLFNVVPAQPETAINYYLTILNGDYTPTVEELENFNYYIGYAYYLTQDLDSAWEYAREAAEDNWLRQTLSPRLITLDYNIPLEESLNYYWNRYQSGVYEMLIFFNTDYQELISVESDPSYIELKQVGREVYAVFDFSAGIPDNFEITLALENRMINQAPEYLTTYPDDDSELGFYSHYNNSFYDTKNAELIALVNELTENCDTTLEKVVAIHEWISENNTHIYNIDREYYDDPAHYPDYDSIAEMLDTRIGHCYHFSVLFTTMCRIIEVPARVIGGGFLEDASLESGDIASHYTAEVWDPDNGRWFYVEPQNADYFGINSTSHIIFTGRLEEERNEDTIYLKSITETANNNEIRGYKGVYELEFLDE